MRPIADVAREAGLSPSDVEPWGPHVVKVRREAVERLRGTTRGKLVIVTAITPTAHGEGKTTTAIGLAQAFRRLGRSAIATLRQPTLGPVFGIKGGGTGGGRSELVPRERIDFHLTGDSHAVQSAHNLAAAFLENHLHHGNALGIDPASIVFPRVTDLSDRALRRVVVGLGGRENGPPREAEVVITSASEVMASLALAEDLADLRKRLGRIVVGRRRGGEPATLEDLRVAGAMAALLRDAVSPNLAQSVEGAPALVHAGPFGNIAHGCSSVIADRVALALADRVVTEAGFGADLGAEKHFHVKCRASGLRPGAAVLVATVRALKLHGGAGTGKRGADLDRALAEPDPGAVERGAANLARHVGIVRAFGLPCVVAANAFPTDSAGELDALLAAARSAGARGAEVARPFEQGGEGCLDLARAVDAALAGPPAELRFLYPEDLPLAGKVEVVARQVYGAGTVEVSQVAARALAELERLGFGRLPVCVAKTHLSLSHDPTLRGAPSGFAFPVREARLAAGAGFVTVLAGEVQLMPGLPSRPAGEAIDLDAKGEVVGLR